MYRKYNTIFNKIITVFMITDERIWQGKYNKSNSYYVH